MLAVYLNHHKQTLMMTTLAHKQAYNMQSIIGSQVKFKKNSTDTIVIKGNT